MKADKVLKFFRPFVIWFGNISLPFTVKKINGKHYYKWKDSLKTGDILLTSTDGHGSTWLNFTSDYKHSGIYIGKINRIPYVAEATGKGVILTDLVTFFTTKDRLCIIQNKKINEYHTAGLQIAAKKLEGLEYDYLFDSGNKKYYCHELCTQLIKHLNHEIILKKEVVGLLWWKKEAYTPKTFLEDNINFKVIGDI